MSRSMVKNAVFALSYLFFVEGSHVFSQETYGTKSGEIRFEAVVSSFVPVKAVNKEVSAILNAESGELAVLVLIRDFRFKVALMEEHFNENYMESQHYPKATFKGRLQRFSKGVLADGRTVETMVKGQLTIKGSTKEVASKAMVKKQDGRISLQTVFEVNPSDFDIEIPKIVQNKIGDNVSVTVALTLVER